jgi:hypothetical protein
MEVRWTLPQLEGYISTWSALGRHRSVVGTDPLPDLVRRLAPLWGAGATRDVRWPLVVRVGHKPT